MFYLLSLSLLLSHYLVVATLSLVQPLQSQYPIIARVGQPYSWTFLPPFNSSFNTTTLSYSITGAPSWLSLQATTLTLSGTPTSKDLGTPAFSIRVADNNDHASDSLKLYVTDRPAPQVNYTAAAQFIPGNPSLASVFFLRTGSALYQAGIAPSLRIPPSWSFSVGFDASTFVSPGGENVYYTSSPLPDWIKFNDQALTFNGVTPKWSENLTTVVEIILHGSDQQGYSAVSQKFDLVIAAHELYQNTSLMPINITMGQKFDKGFDISNLQAITLDNRTLNSLQDLIVTIGPSTTSWIDSTSALRISGTAPSSPTSATLPLVVSSLSLNQTIRTNLTLNVVSSVFVNPNLPTLVASPGSHVNLDLQQYFINSKISSDLNVSVADSDAPWLTYNATTCKLNGDVPLKPGRDKFVVTIFARSRTGGNIYEAQLPFALASESAPSSVAQNHSASKQVRTILVAVMSSVIAVVIFAGIFAYCRSHGAARRDREKGVYVVDENGEGYWREKGGVDNFTIYQSANDLNQLEKPVEFHDLGPTPRTNNSQLPGGHTPSMMVKGEFQRRLRNPFGSKSKRRPEISNPVTISVPRMIPGAVPPTITGDFTETDSTGSGSTEDGHLGMGDYEEPEQPRRRSDFGPRRSSPNPFVPRPSLKRQKVPIEEDEYDADATELTRASILNIVEGRPRLVNMTQPKSAMFVSPRKVSQKGVVVSTSDGSGTRSAKSRVSQGSTLYPSPSFRDNAHIVSRSARGSASDGAVSHRMSQPQTPSPRSRTSVIFFDDPPTQVRATSNYSSGSHSGQRSMHIKPEENFVLQPPFPMPSSYPDLTAVLEDGRRLPSWLKFDSDGGEFHGRLPREMMPQNKRSGDNSLVVVVKMRGEDCGKFRLVIDS